ncbi:serine protease inhibitor Kazal-type 9-like [Trichosurus vulpecula]|uniref:serine protease inhibitor Kazal-type 9-like n=1 Tax=Trichosurus vulpecula TaxID=9337 RepID=UPI00186B153C|nr:serine protease inhibitor Kazal-type 9-like [Trichosurus vulpecula]
MKAAAACMFLMLALMPIFYVESASKQEVDCSGFKKLPPGKVRFCPQIYEPICGSDGKKYSNSCFFCSAVKQSDDKIKSVHLEEC